MVSLIYLKVWLEKKKKHNIKQGIFFGEKLI